MVIIKEKGNTRKEFDLYKTPREFVREALMPIVPYKSFLNKNYALERLSVLNPGCADGVWGLEFRKLYSNVYIVGYDIRDVKPNYDEFYKQDFLTVEPRPVFDYVIGNPPFKYAEEFVRKGLAFLRHGGQLVFVLRLAFLESLKRGKGLFKEFKPFQVSVSMRRIPFLLDELNKGSDDTAYAVFYWMKDYDGETYLDWLDWSLDEKKESR